MRRGGVGTTSMNTVSKQMQSFIRGGANARVKTFSRDTFSTVSRTMHTRGPVENARGRRGIYVIYFVPAGEKAGKIAAKASLCAAWRTRATISRNLH